MKRSAATATRSSSRTIGALSGAWGAAGKEPDRWRHCVILNIPPFAIFGENILKYAQIKRSFYFWYFQMQRVCERVISADNFAFIDNLWADWSPHYDASKDLRKAKDCIRDPAHLQAALGYYWAQFDPTRFLSYDWVAEQKAIWGKNITQPTLYLHGTKDGAHGLTQEGTVASADRRKRAGWADGSSCSSVCAEI